MQRYGHEEELFVLCMSPDTKMNRILSADLVVPVSMSPIRNGWIEINEDGRILSVNDDAVPENAEHFNGVLIPGFINAHCHLELSHLRGRIAENQGMSGFIRGLLAQRFTVSIEEQQIAMRTAEDEMIRNGIVAVGDISNFANSFEIKKFNRLQYHTFVEVLGLNPDVAAQIIASAMSLRKQFASVADHTSTIAPHAPYTVSEELFRLINEQSTEDVVSIHMEESADEDEFCRFKTGPLADLFAEAGFTTEHFVADRFKSPLRQTVPKLTNCRRLLLVHNTFTTYNDITFAESVHKNNSWCLCPNANLFITGKLPDFTLFEDDRMHVVIGTDSLASNHQLSVAEELKTIRRYAPQLSFYKLVKWATLNGAEALSIHQDKGSLKKGMRPGLVLLENINPEEPHFNKDVSVKRIA